MGQKILLINYLLLLFYFQNLYIQNGMLPQLLQL
nr:MAG TPA: hypothetical protein [Bacteriophage sp.]